MEGTNLLGIEYHRHSSIIHKEPIHLLVSAQVVSGVVSINHNQEITCVKRTDEGIISDSDVYNPVYFQHSCPL